MSMKCIPADANHRIKYLYDEDATGICNGYKYKGIVIAIMDRCKTDALKDVNNIICTTIHGYYYGTCPCIEREYKGIAYCSVDDEFDLKEGMKVARGRLLNKYYKDKLNAYKKAANQLKKQVTAIETLCDKTTNILANHTSFAKMDRWTIRGI